MSGIIVDMTIINILLRNYFPKLIPFLDNKNENYGDYIGNNFINVNLINLFTNENINKKTSLFIWDLLFLDGKIILIKAFLAIYHYLLPFILKSEQTIENFQSIIKSHLKKLTCDNQDLIFYLVIKEYNFSEEEIDQARFSLSINTANSIRKEKEKINIRKKSIDKKEKIECNIDWPICKYEHFYLNNDVMFFLVLQKKKKNFLKNYFFDKFKKENKDDNSNNKTINKNINNDKDLLIERKKHYCLKKEEIIEENNQDKINENINEEEEELNSNNEEDYNNYNKIINKPEFIEASKNVINDLKIKLKNKEKDENKELNNINNE